jgi:hypothetical protein
MANPTPLAADQWHLARPASLAGLKAALQDPRLRWVYAERMEDTVLTELKEFLTAGVDLSRWKHGRAFGPEVEVAWWQMPAPVGEVEARAFAADGAPPKGLAWQPDRRAALTSLGIEDVLLLGEGDADPTRPAASPAWSVQRIPRYLRYPVDGKPPRVVLQVETYLVAGLRREQRLVRLIGG